MKILAIDTSSSVCSVALLVNDEIYSLERSGAVQQAQWILPMIEELLQAHSVTLKELDALAFGRGPGSFTGVRIATSVIQGLGFALNLPIIPVSSLAAVAQAAFAELGWRKLLVAMDARIQEVYWGAYQVSDQGLVVLTGDEAVLKPVDIVYPEAEGWCGVGDAWQVYKDQMNYEPLSIDPTRLPLASGILQLAKPRFLIKDWVSAEEALPIYLRDNVAKPKV